MSIRHPGRRRRFALPLLVGVVLAAAVAAATAGTASAATHCDAVNFLCAEDISAVAGVQFSGEVGTLTEVCGLPVTIDWGDGSPTTDGTPSCTPAGFGNDGTYSGTHTYSAPGNYTITLTAPDIQINNVVDSVTSTATVRAAAADLSLAMNTQSTAKPNSTLLYTLVVANAGPDAAVNAALTVTLPYGTSYQALTAPAGWTCSHPTVGSLGGTITCTNPSFASGGSSATSIGVKVKAKANKGAVIAAASVSSNTADPNSANNSASAATNIVNK